MNRSGNIFPIAETEIEYCTETEEKIINFFLNGEFNEALLLLAEITLEANPGTLTEKSLKFIKRQGLIVLRSIYITIISTNY